MPFVQSTAASHRTLSCPTVVLAAIWALFATISLHAADAPYKLPESNWKPLFNGRDLSNWDKFLASPDGKGPLVPNVDPKGVFSVTNVDGAPAIHVSGEIFGAITTHEQFENFHFRLQFKWGEKRWPARANVARDSGILYCAIGEPNPSTGWMTSVENNIMEKGVGQWWSVNRAIIDTEGEWITAANELYVPYKKEGDGERNIVWRKDGPRLTALGPNGITPPFDVEQVFGNWNTVEVIFWAGQCIHILNGRVNLVAVKPRYIKEERTYAAFRSLLHGRIQLQSEAAEVFYRNVEIRPLYELPTQHHNDALPPFAEGENFTPLLSPEALKDWKQSGAGKFTVTDGVATAEGGMGLWWYAGRAYTNFVLRGEFVQEQASADSGVFLRFPNPGMDPWNAVKQGHEMEIGDPNPENPTWRTGSFYPFHASTAANTKPAGQWNSFEIACIGHSYSARLNGKLVTTWTDTTKRSLVGHIGLQNYDDKKTVRFRNLRVKDLW